MTETPPRPAGSLKRVAVSFVNDGDGHFDEMPGYVAAGDYYYADEVDQLLATQMTEERAREILGTDLLRAVISDSCSLRGGVPWVYWSREKPTDIELDGNFSADHLEAMAWWMRNKGAK